MARDVFNREVDLGAPLAADATRLLLADIGEEDMLVQNVSIQYKQNINRLYEVGSSKTFFIAGRTEGTISIKRIIGGKGVQGGFVTKYGDVCNMANNHMTFTFEAGCTDGSNVGKITASACVIQSVAYSVAASDMIINEDITLMFARLEY
jgi:hypothetical protein